MSWYVLSKSINIERRGKTSRMQHADPMRSDAAHCPMQPSDPIQAATAALTEAIVAPGAMERTAKMAEAKMIFMIVDCLLVWCRI